MLLLRRTHVIISLCRLMIRCNDRPVRPGEEQQQKPDEMSSEARTRGSGSLTSGERSSSQLHSSVTPDKAPVDRAAAIAAPPAAAPQRQFLPTRKLSPAEF